MTENLNEMVVQIMVEFHQPLGELEKLPIIKLMELMRRIVGYTEAREEYRKSRRREG